ncbi:MAG: fumarylacetoacetate hydrolase family protein [Deferribacteres bacterium]|nr:fumarylacetoacetate hydrolase family protein [candidate division KSB1 bacterium]MCB9509089.1 fumarylacetoacetate hydrolase family protein [Deferribacteres bacterium]
MKLFKLSHGILIEKNSSYFLLADADWDGFINDDALFQKVHGINAPQLTIDQAHQRLAQGIDAPMQSQELWASGVTYFRSKQGRQEESKNAGGGDFYARVYEAERPELFFKANAHRVVGHGGAVRIRRDSNWNVPEPELTLVITTSGKIVGYTIGNDMSSRSIEGENPLYLPQAKTYDKCAALGPCIYVTDQPLPAQTTIDVKISRNQRALFSGQTHIGQMKRTPQELVSFLYRECSFPHGSLLMTGTGIVPPNDFSLQSGDAIAITMEPIGTLENKVE